MATPFDHRLALMSRTAALIAAVGVLAGAGASDALADGPHGWFPPSNGFTDHVAFDGAQLEHASPGGHEPLTKPDDITFLDGHIFVAFQNGVGAQGEASASGNLDSTVVELDRSGRPVEQWDIVGKCDGLTADPSTRSLIATVNEDANSSLYTIDPTSGTIVHYDYSEPLPSDGGTDAISIYRGMVLVSASAPGTTGSPAPQASYPAVYQVDLDAATGVAAIHPLFGDEAPAAQANVGAGGSVALMLTDPDSSEDVPFFAPRFAGDFMLTSQGDQEQVFVSDAGGPHQSLSVLKLSSSVDDTAWPLVPWGALYVTDNRDDTVNRITGLFQPGSELVADTPCDESSAPSTCPAPGFPANFLGQVNPWTGAISPVSVSGAAVQPQGMLFLP
ncbi:MAG TPA: hypothetical protein VGX72_11895 [Solirubrobacteraceae bacterium]|jgi:hypothetical protein|nr:hypothetical protein [Solirubrobacteraceae bacterium]